jgi:NADPH-dependent F420 reductase
MKVAIIGGTGKLGSAFAMRLSKTGHEAVIGSRDPAKAEEAANMVGANVRGTSNAEAAAWCEAALLSVPYTGHSAILEPLKDALGGKLFIDATVPLDPANLRQIKSASGKSAAEEAAAILSGAAVFAAFQTISHRVLSHMEDSHDVLVAGDSARKREVLELIRSIGLRPIDAGPLEVAGHLERMTALLLSINRANKVKESGIKITGI